MGIEIKLTPPDGVALPFTHTDYLLEVNKISNNTSQKLHEYKIKDDNKFLVEGFEHSSTSISINGTLTVDSGFVGDTLEDKKDNLIKAAAEWWQVGNPKKRTECAQLYWRGWSQYVLIERLEVIKVAGEDDSYDYIMSFLVHEGK